MPRGSLGGEQWHIYYYTLDTLNWKGVNCQEGTNAGCPGKLAEVETLRFGSFALSPIESFFTPWDPVAAAQAKSSIRPDPRFYGGTTPTAANYATAGAPMENGGSDAVTCDSASGSPSSTPTLLVPAGVGAGGDGPFRHSPPVTTPHRSRGSAASTAAAAGSAPPG